MNLWESINIFLAALSSNRFVRLVLIAVMLDTVLGLLRAIKEHKFNSCFGIDGAIRKIAMVISVVVLALVDRILGFNMLPFIPDTVMKFIGITQMGICEFFCLLYVMYETVSILKNMCLCGLPIPSKIRKAVEKWLNLMTSELDDKVSDISIGGDSHENH